MWYFFNGSSSKQKQALWTYLKQNLSLLLFNYLFPIMSQSIWQFQSITSLLLTLLNCSKTWVSVSLGLCLLCFDLENHSREKLKWLWAQLALTLFFQEYFTPGMLSALCIILGFIINLGENVSLYTLLYHEFEISIHLF